MELESKSSLLLNGYENTVFSELKKSLESCERFYFNVAFISYGGLQLFVKLLKDLGDKGIKGKVITSTYLNFSDPKALKKLFAFDNIEMKVYSDVKTKGYHSKAYLFEYKDYYKVIIGSSNITASALKSNIEWNVKMVSKKDDPFMLDVIEEFTDMWDSLEKVDEIFLDEYDDFIRALKDDNKEKRANDFFDYRFTIKPNSMQTRAMNNLKKIREYGEEKALVIAATGTGKTFMSAFDVQQFSPKKVLFIVHREEILKSAEESFKRVLGSEINTGFFTGTKKDDNAKYLFATIQSMRKYYMLYDRDEFDYIIIDEAHHCAGNSYQKVMDYFTPLFMVGMTATPERCDNADIFGIFDNNVAIEVRLHEAMEEELVCPFHYFGISDYNGIDLEGIKLSDSSEVARVLKINQRVDYIIENMLLYGYDGEQRRCLAFCVNVNHAKFMCDEFNRRGFKSICLTGEDNVEHRASYMRQLSDKANPLEFIFTVDIFNEGIDIPSINLVLMLRPTNSPIIFIQQLGRGLRKVHSKEYLTVLDFIGNHNRAFLIAVALNGSRYYDKDSLKVSVATDFINIPGNTFVQLDEISKERILEQIELENFNSMAYLKEEYLAFKFLLKGKTPNYLMDYLKYEGAPDPIKFVNNGSTYVGFLSKVEKDDCFDDLLLDEAFGKYLKYISDMLPLKRPFEFGILLEIIAKETLNVEESKRAVLKSVETIKVDSVLHSMETLSFKFYDSAELKRWTQFVYLEDDKIQLSADLKSILLDARKKKYIEDTLYYGLARYRIEFEEKNYGVPFLKLHSQYTMKELALLSNVRKKHSSFRGSGLITADNEYFLFVDLHKDEEIREEINYKDKFISRKLFQWQSPNQTTQSTDRGMNITKNKERGINLHLFVRKFKKIDNAVQPYIYMGKADTKEYEGNKPITVIMRMQNEVPANIYEELINNVNKKTDA